MIAGSDCDSMLVESDSDICNNVGGGHGDIKYVRNTHSSNTISLFGISVPPGAVFEIIYLDSPTSKWYIVGSG